LTLPVPDGHQELTHETQYIRPVRLFEDIHQPAVKIDRKSGNAAGQQLLSDGVRKRRGWLPECYGAYKTQ